VSVVAIALGLLVAGAVSGALVLVYVAIGVAVLALILLVAGVLIWRDEVFGAEDGADRREQLSDQAAAVGASADHAARGYGAAERGRPAARSAVVTPADRQAVEASPAGRNGRPTEPVRASPAPRRGQADDERARDRHADAGRERDAAATHAEPERSRHEDPRRDERRGRDDRTERLGAQPVVAAAASHSDRPDPFRQQPDARRVSAEDQRDARRAPGEDQRDARRAPGEDQPDSPRLRSEGQPTAVGRRSEDQLDRSVPRPEGQPDAPRRRPEDQPESRQGLPDTAATRSMSARAVPAVNPAASTQAAAPAGPEPTAASAAGPGSTRVPAGAPPETAADRPPATRQNTQVAPAIRNPSPGTAPDAPAVREPAARTPAGAGHTIASAAPAAASAAPAGAPAPVSAAPAAGATRAAPPAPQSSAIPSPDVTVVPGIARYHKKDCILIRFLGDDDLETMSRERAEESGCVPCRACRPEMELATAES